ncbi:oligosaccharide flippase family protein [Spirosoma foliorum]|uniref:Oligosaccharide flippase family protein n=1 Tax=Spirosoma foliorum TaxID=2710596 RepID=A0A7G5H2C8_9BACT|nr:oligosaccharide flippase family protein [Spirosoma foliorum]QMW05270.1 oligosaccharide flippase family protein [Spirosoma foliorum]
MIKSTFRQRIDARSLIVYRNIVESILLKGAGVLIGFLTVTLTVQYISVKDFGIWMTITYLTSWFSLVDVSFGNGLRNSLMLFFDTGDDEQAKKYVSTLYFLSGMVALLLCVVFGIIHFFLDWTLLLNIDSNQPALINTIITYTLLSFSIQLLLKPINSILLADQRASAVAGILFFVNLLIISIIYIASIVLHESLLVIAHIYNVVPVLVYGGVSVYYFRTTYSRLGPGITHIDVTLIPKLITVSGQFFFLQLISVIVFTSGGLFISYYLGSDSVAPYSIANKYFSVLPFIYGIFITPYWSAFTDAYLKQDTAWIQATIRRLNLICVATAGLALLMLVVAQPVFSVWIGTKIYIPTSLAIWLTAYVISFIFLSNYNYFVNGVGQIKPLVHASLAGIVLYFPLNYVLFRFTDAGATSVVIAGTIWNCYLLIVCMRQYRQIMTRLNHKPAVYALQD